MPNKLALSVQSYLSSSLLNRGLFYLPTLILLRWFSNSYTIIIKIILRLCKRY